MNRLFVGFAVTAALLFANSPVVAELKITEVMSSSGAGGTEDWFEVTNTGLSAVSVTNWRMDDGSANYTFSVPLRGISSIAPGESVIFLELASPAPDDMTVDTTGATNAMAFRAFWGAPTTGLQIGYYNGTGLGVGLSSTSGTESVNLFDEATMALIAASVPVPVATSGFSFEYITNPSSSTLSVDGVLGAFVSANPLGNVGSPGFTANAIPEPSTWALIFTTFGGMGLMARRHSKR